MPTSSIRVAYRYLESKALGRGETLERNGYRIHRFNDSLRLTDLTNAGKRGKKVDEFWASWWRGGDPELQGAIEDWMEFATRARDFKALAAAIQVGITMLKDDHNITVESGWHNLRGVDVTPAGFTKLKVDGDGVHIESGYDDFVIRDLVDRNNEPTCIARGKKSIKQFYRWVSDNQAKIKKMKFRDVLKAMDAENIDYHYFCAMD